MMDRRWGYVRHLEAHASNLSFQEMETFRAAIVHICLTHKPVQSPDQAGRLVAVGTNPITILKKQKTFNFNLPANGKFPCAAAAILVGLLDWENLMSSPGSLCGWSKLKCLAKARYNGEGGEFVAPEKFNSRLIPSIHWSQLATLKSGTNGTSLIEQKQRTKLDPATGLVYRLTTEGKVMARRLLGVLDLTNTSSLSSSSVSTSSISSSSSILSSSQSSQSSQSLISSTSSSSSSSLLSIESAPLYMYHPNGRDETGIVILVDDREGGGDRHYLQRIATTFTTEKLRFETARLPSKLHDYSFVYRQSMGKEDIVLPLLIERKAESDLASSMTMKDGRWERQHNSMQQTAIELFGAAGCRCLYILEGNVYQTLNCSCSCNGVGGCMKLGYPSQNTVRENVNRRSKCFIGDFDIEFHSTKDVLGTCRLLLKFRNMIHDMYSKGVQLKGVRKSDASRRWMNEIQRPTLLCPVEPVELTKKVKVIQSPIRNNVASFLATPETKQNTTEEEKSDKTELKLQVPSFLAVKMDATTTTTTLNNGDYIPSVSSCNWAILVWLAANATSSTVQFNKETIMHGCDHWNLSTKGMNEKTTQLGMYDGWSGVEQYLIKKWSLVKRHYRNKGVETKYSLTDKGKELGNLLHSCAHYQNICGCKNNNVIKCSNVYSRVILDKWPLKILQKECKRLGLTVSGKKSELVAKIRQHKNSSSSSSSSSNQNRTPTKKFGKKKLTTTPITAYFGKIKSKKKQASTTSNKTPQRSLQFHEDDHRSAKVNKKVSEDEQEVFKDWDASSEDDDDDDEEEGSEWEVEDANTSVITEGSIGDDY